MLPGCIAPKAVSFFFISAISLFSAEVLVLVFITAKLYSFAVIVNKESETMDE